MIWLFGEGDEMRLEEAGLGERLELMEVRGWMGEDAVLSGIWACETRTLPSLHAKTSRHTERIVSVPRTMKPTPWNRDNGSGLCTDVVIPKTPATDDGDRCNGNNRSG
jgi:hypothetical protein